LLAKRLVAFTRDKPFFASVFSRFQGPPILESRDGMLSQVIGSKDITEFKSRCQFRQE
jgi:hypothetical protein